MQPWWFGDPFEKKTCLWLKGLPPLEKTYEVKPEERVKFASGKSMPKWYTDAANLPPAERSRIRSQTFPGFAAAMAEQWGFYIDPITTVIQEIKLVEELNKHIEEKG